MAGRAPSFFGDAVGKVIKERQELLKVEAQKAQKAEKALEKLRKEFEKVESQLAATKEEVAHLNAELELQEEKHAAELEAQAQRHAPRFGCSTVARGGTARSGLGSRLSTLRPRLRTLGAPARPSPP